MNAMVDQTVQSGESAIKLDGFHEYMSTLHKRADELLGRNHGIAFLTDVNKDSPIEDPLFVGFLEGFIDPAIRQEYNCRCCKHFLRNYGSAVYVDQQTGHTRSLFWNEDLVDEPFKAATRSMRLIVEASPIVSQLLVDRVTPGVNVKYVGEKFKGSYEEDGQPKLYEHFQFDVSYLRDGLYAHKTARQNMAESKEIHRIFAGALGAYRHATIAQARAYFANDQILKCYPKYLQYLDLFLTFVTKLGEVKHGATQQRVRSNLIWLASVMLPLGVTRIQNSVVGEFLDGLAVKAPLATLIKTFQARVNPVDYQRPKAAPTQANVETATKIVAKLGIESSLKRRYAKYEDILAFAWQAKVEETSEAGVGGVFAHLKTKDEGLRGPEHLGELIQGGTQTWERFFEKIVPTADKLELVVPHHLHANFGSMTTAVDPDAPPIIRWDSPERRNPVTTYIHAEQSPHGMWNIPAGRAVIKAIVDHPSHWFGGKSESHQVHMLLIEGARATAPAGGLALFPSNLRPELHEVRATIEQFSNQGELEGLEDSMGFLMLGRNGGQIGIQLIATVKGVATIYTIDRAV